jgi:AraC-like DNA-binding protein
MGNAAKYLWETDYDISLIASSVGYGDLCCFSRAFKRYYGVSPNAFRKERP